MFQRIARLSVYATIFTMFVIACAARADEPKTSNSGNAKSPGAARAPAANAGPALKNKRRVVPVRFGSAKDLAAVLEKHFQGEAEFQVVPEGANNNLLVAATAAVYDEVLETVAELDRSPQKVIVDVLMADVVSKHDAAPGEEAAGKGVDSRDFTGPIDDVIARLEKLGKQRGVVNFQHMRLESLEDREGTFQDGQQKPFINGFTANATTGLASPLLQQRAVGTIITVTPRVVDVNKVLLKLVVRTDRMGSPEDGIHLADGVDGPLIASEVATMNLTGTLTVPIGQAVIINQVQTDSKSKRTRTRIIIAARIAKEPPQAEK
jgi:type II secretory pathway component GspD/PulD (secretin)